MPCDRHLASSHLQDDRAAVSGAHLRGCGGVGGQVDVVTAPLQQALSPDRGKIACGSAVKQ